MVKIKAPVVKKFRKRYRKYFKKDIEGRKAFNTNPDLIRF